MTKISYHVENNVHTLTAEGHAGYNTGNDIVCSSCSTLFYALVNSLLGNAPEKISYEAGNGKGKVVCSAANEKEKAFFEMAMTGYKALQQEYPDYVQVLS